MPFTFRDVDEAEGTRILGDAVDTWAIARRGGSWVLAEADHTEPSARAVVDQAVAWKVFTKRGDRETDPVRDASPRGGQVTTCRLRATLRIVHTVAVLVGPFLVGRREAGCSASRGP